jgi:ferredoxin-NADP reductase
MDKHHFGVVSRIFKRSHDDKLSQLLPSLTYGDEVAVKYGENVLNYKGSENPIKHLTIVASGVGIVPVLDIIKRILGDSDYEIEGCELLWINDSEEDFIFNKEVEKLEHLYPDQFSCARVLDHAVTDKDSILDARVENALPLSEPGRVALVAAPHTVSQKFKPVLDALVYPPQNVISIPVH